MADIAQDIANSAIAYAHYIYEGKKGLIYDGLEAKMAIRDFDDRFSYTYHGGPMRTLIDAWRYRGGTGRNINPTFPYVGGAGFRSDFKDSGTETYGGPDADQTHHFSAYLSLGINGLWSAKKYHERGDNTGDQNLGRAAYYWVSKYVKDTSSSRISGNIFVQAYAADPVGDCISESKVKLLSRKTFLAFGLGLLVLVSGASTCETNPKWDIRGGNPPQFVVSGSGRLISLRVYGPGERTSESDIEPYGTRYWEIRPKDGYDFLTQAKLSPVSYGTVPEGFVQIYPEGSPPKPLFEGGRFGFSLVVEGGDGVNALCTIRHDKVVVEPH